MIARDIEQGELGGPQHGPAQIGVATRKRQHQRDPRSRADIGRHAVGRLQRDRARHGRGFRGRRSRLPKGRPVRYAALLTGE
jgi:hypothetical protein